METNRGKTDQKVISDLINTLSSDDGFVRENSRLALIDIGKDATSFLIEALTSKKDQVRWEAAKTLVSIADPATIPALIKTLQDEIFDIRWLAAEALIAIGIESIEPLLRSLTSYSKELFLREGAHHVITSIITTDSRAYELKEILKSVEAALDSAAPRAAVPIAAEEALNKLEQAKK